MLSPCDTITSSRLSDVHASPDACLPCSWSAVDPQSNWKPPHAKCHAITVVAVRLIPPCCMNKHTPFLCPDSPAFHKLHTSHIAPPSLQSSSQSPQAGVGSWKLQSAAFFFGRSVSLLPLSLSGPNATVPAQSPGNCSCGFLVLCCKNILPLGWIDALVMDRYASRCRLSEEHH